MNGFEEIDVHRMTKVQAITAIDAKLKRVDSGVYSLRVIHGYHGGTVLRDAVRARYAKHPKVRLSGYEHLPPVSVSFRRFLSRLTCWAPAQRRSLGAKNARKLPAHRC